MTKIVFIDPLGWDYTPQTPRDMPLGGSQSALCYLSEALALRGLDVTIVTGTSTPGLVRGVLCLNGVKRPWEHIENANLVVVLNECPPRMATNLRLKLPACARLVLWTQHAHDEPAIADLHDPAMRDVWDNFVFVSEWQLNEYVHTFGINQARCIILRNGFAPSFAHLFRLGERISNEKSSPPILAYTSTPFRGLDVLLKSFPAIRSALPGCRLQIFSSLAPYQVAAEADPYKALYQRCAETDGVEYIGALSQATLADRLRGVTALAYPNRFPETSCISVLEALAAGCLVVSSRLGALPETGMGFAHLISVPSDKETHASLYAQHMIRILSRNRSEEAHERRLRAQVEKVNAAKTWTNCAEAWIAWIRDIRGEFTAPTTIAIGRALQSYNPDRAATLARQAITANPQDDSAWRQLAEAEMAQARWTRAVRCFSRAAVLTRLARLPTELAHELTLNVASDPLEDCLDALNVLADFSPAAASVVASQGERVASEENDFKGADAMCQLTTASTQDEAMHWISRAWAETQSGRHTESLTILNAMLAALGAKALAGEKGRILARRSIENAEKALLMGATPAVAAITLRKVASLSEALGEAVSELVRTAEQMEMLLPNDTANAALLITFALGRRRLAQGRPSEAYPLLKQAADWGAASTVTTSLLQAGIAQSQGLLLEALHFLLDTGRQGKAPQGWRRSAAEMIAHIDQSLLLEHNSEQNRSKSWGTVRGFDAWLRFTEVPNPPTPATPKRRIIDCFQFYNELDLLEVRLIELAPVVDRFVLVEARFTHAGDLKPLFFEQNQHRFAAYLDRIEHVIIDNDPGGFSWTRESYQREAIARGISDLADDDMVLISDVDEIPRRSVVATLRDMPADLYSLELAIHLYFLDLKSPESWISAAAAPGRLIKRIGVNPVRYLVKQGIGCTIEAAGWHFTWMGGLDGFRAKMQAYAHRENSEVFMAAKDSEARLKQFYATGQFEAGLVPGMWNDLGRVAIDEGFPVGIREQVEKFRAHGWLCP
jgi:glycosyltransferase involved in cell wall biosynthesis